VGTFKKWFPLLWCLPLVLWILWCGGAAWGDVPASAVPAGVVDPRLALTPSGWQVLLSCALIAVVVVLLRLSSRWPAALRLNVLVAIAIGGWYLWWRATQTLSLDSPLPSVLSVTLFVAECYGLLSLLFFYVQVWSPLRRSAPPLPAEQTFPTVDIFVTIFDEPPEVLYRTLVGCQAIRYPEGKKQVYVLDDGHRDEIRQMAERLGCRYLSRPTNEHAKAGNLNYALQHTGGELIINFDTDHVPVRTFLERTIGYFTDPAVALVQTAHHFYNPDPYQENLRMTGEIVHEQELFFQVIQPGRDRHNSAFFCGSGGVLRRSALQAIGGFLTSTTTEDIHTSIRLHAHGYRSVYVSERLSAGLSPESFESYLKQRDRWAQGHAQILLTRENPLWAAGLTFMQRVNYLASISYFFLGLPRIIYLAVPLSYLLFGVPPLMTNVWMLLVHFVPYYVASLLVFNAVGGRQRNPFWSDVYETAICFAVTTATLRAVFHPRLVTFYVTPKGIRRAAVAMGKGIMPHAVMAALLIAGIVWGGMELVAGTGNTQAGTLSIVLGLYNLFLLTAAVVVARQRSQLRGSPRLARRLPCQVGVNGHSLDATVLDLSETGLSLTMTQMVRLPPIVTLTIRNGLQEQTAVIARVVRNDRNESGQSFVGMAYMDLKEEQHQSILRQMYSDPEAWRAPALPTGGFWPSLMLLLTAGLRAFVREMVVRRLSPRVRKELRCDLRINGLLLKTLTEDIGLNGLCVRLQEPLPDGARLKPGPVHAVLYPGDGRQIGCLGEIVWVRPDRIRPMAGILLVRYDQQELERLVQQA
jgi:cellulose synthase (UDP-forming)